MNGAQSRRENFSMRAGSRNSNRELELPPPARAFLLRWSIHPAAKKERPCYRSIAHFLGEGPQMTEIDTGSNGIYD
jgi:hypothetical protein